MYFKLGVSEDILASITQELKTAEGRRKSSHLRGIEPGDVIAFNGTDMYRVKEIEQGDHFADVLHLGNFKAAIPHAESVDAAVARYGQFYSDARQRKNGVMLLHIEYAQGLDGFVSAFTQPPVEKYFFKGKEQNKAIAQGLGASLDALWRESEKYRSHSVSPTPAQSVYNIGRGNLAGLFHLYHSICNSRETFDRAVENILDRFESVTGKNVKDSSLQKLAQDAVEKWEGLSKKRLKKFPKEDSDPVNRLAYSSILTLLEARCFRMVHDAEFFPDQLDFSPLL